MKCTECAICRGKVSVGAQIVMYHLHQVWAVYFRSSMYLWNT